MKWVDRAVYEAKIWESNVKFAGSGASNRATISEFTLLMILYSVAIYWQVLWRVFKVSGQEKLSYLSGQGEEC